MNKLIDTANTSFNQASCEGTGLDGLHSVNNWLNKGYTLFKCENLSINFDDKVLIKSNNLKKVYELDYTVIPQLMLFEALQNNINLDEFLERAETGKPTLSQSKYKLADKQKTIIDDRQVLTSKEYLKLNIIEALKELQDDNRIFTQLLSILSSDKSDIYQIKVNKETELFVKFEELSKLGFSDIKQVKDNKLRLSISLKKSQTAFTEAIILGYVVESTTLNSDMASLNIVMLDKQ